MERDESGRFVAGNSISKKGGRPPRAAEDDFISLIDSAVTSNDWREIIGRAVVQAKRGDSTARAWLTDRRYGKAKERSEVEATGDLGVLIWDVTSNGKRT